MCRSLGHCGSPRRCDACTPFRPPAHRAMNAVRMIRMMLPPCGPARSTMADRTQGWGRPSRCSHSKSLYTSFSMVQRPTGGRWKANLRPLKGRLKVRSKVRLRSPERRSKADLIPPLQPRIGPRTGWPRWLPPHALRPTDTRTRQIDPRHRMR